MGITINRVARPRHFQVSTRTCLLHIDYGETDPGPYN